MIDLTPIDPPAARTAAMPNEPHAVYRLFDEAGALLYVGMSHWPAGRIDNHRKDKPWRHEIHRWAVTWYRSKDAALSIERTAIEAELPKYNRAHTEEYDQQMRMLAAGRGTARATTTRAAQSVDVEKPEGADWPTFIRNLEREHEAARADRDAARVELQEARKVRDTAIIAALSQPNPNAARIAKRFAVSSTWVKRLRDLATSPTASEEINS